VLLQTDGCQSGRRSLLSKDTRFHLLAFDLLVLPVECGLLINSVGQSDLIGALHEGKGIRLGSTLVVWYYAMLYLGAICSLCWHYNWNSNLSIHLNSTQMECISHAPG